MKKEKQIEEIFNIIVDGVIDGDDNNGMPTGNTCVNIAKDIYNAGYRKVTDGAVVLLIGENNQALDKKTIEYFVKHNEKIRKEAVIEFAENLKEKIKSLKVAEDEDYIFKCGFDVLQENLPEIIDELLKEYEK